MNKTRTNIYFIIPNYNMPSWGIGMLYHLVALSRSYHLNASILRIGSSLPFPEWLQLDDHLPQITIAKLKNEISPDDIVVVPEVLAAHQDVRPISARRIVFVQGGFLINQGLAGASSFQELGYERAMVVMPHIHEILDRFWPIKTNIISPYVPDYFFLDESKLGLKGRKKQIVLFPKPGYSQAGYFDFEIANSLLRKETGQFNQKNSKEQWEIVELKDMNHLEVAETFKTSLFFVNLNCFESLNATVAESMAAGCITFCYEAYGGRDYLQNEKNAYVFANNYIYELLSRLMEVINNLDRHLQELELMQIEAHQTIHRYTRNQTDQDLRTFYAQLGIPLAK